MDLGELAIVGEFARLTSPALRAAREAYLRDLVSSSSCLADPRRALAEQRAALERARESFEAYVATLAYLGRPDPAIDAIRSELERARRVLDRRRRRKGRRR
jgi:hypothetical protein